MVPQHSDPASENPVVIVTGGGSGIGAATAAALAWDEWSVVICGRRALHLQAVADATGAHPIPADVTAVGEPERVVDETIRRFGRLDGLVLNAGRSVQVPSATWPRPTGRR